MVLNLRDIAEPTKTSVPDAVEPPKIMRTEIEWMYPMRFSRARASGVQRSYNISPTHFDDNEGDTSVLNLT